MNRNKVIFLILAVCFLLAMLWIGYDISTRTTFPGSKGNLKERMAPSESDTLPVKVIED
ncbi:hypothetical protein ACFOUP_07675 [Belliella kenyensis]|uniref:Uncharacterized protein n=1 Tax=Belliella kenyensis TaxID=1472724 RepID=A0ABV8EMM8_9BACT|nr:hypothetical protein [Belliella kenyensis]MCH7400353.1 hypothetical protein [Belliella kenyensis]MDN3604629.1 hypothetical protein [Belliella kenyensis]